MKSRPAMRVAIRRLLTFVGLLPLLMFQGFAAEPASPGSRFDRWNGERQRLLDDRSVIAYYDFQEGAGTVLKNKSKTSKKNTTHSGTAQMVSAMSSFRNSCVSDT